tara:strand:+ start:111 stop:518 length:408 start_codon:yes stop_codon:yes gene_type:complete
MRKIAVLLILTMVFGSLAGCLDGEDDNSSPVGEWFVGSELLVELKADGTWTADNDNGTWSVDGDMLSITSENEGDEEIQSIQFTIDDGWLWMKISTEDGDMCIAYSPESMTQEEWDERMESITAPSMCDGLAMAN